MGLQYACRDMTREPSLHFTLENKFKFHFLWHQTSILCTNKETYSMCIHLFLVHLLQAFENSKPSPHALPAGGRKWQLSDASQHDTICQRILCGNTVYWNYTGKKANHKKQMWLLQLDADNCNQIIIFAV